MVFYFREFCFVCVTNVGSCDCSLELKAGHCEMSPSAIKAAGRAAEGQRTAGDTQQLLCASVHRDKQLKPEAEFVTLRSLISSKRAMFCHIHLKEHF